MNFLADDDAADEWRWRWYEWWPCLHEEDAAYMGVERERGKKLGYTDE